LDYWADQLHFGIAVSHGPPLDQHRLVSRRAAVPAAKIFRREIRQKSINFVLLLGISE
jgi:hypothetical protein